MPSLWLWKLRRWFVFSSTLWWGWMGRSESDIPYPVSTPLGNPPPSSLPCCGCRHYHSLPSHRVNWPQEMLCHLMLGHSYERGMQLQMVNWILLISRPLLGHSADCQKSLTDRCSTAVSLQYKLQGLVITVEGALIHTFCRHQSKYTLQPSTT